MSPVAGAPDERGGERGKRDRPERRSPFANPSTNKDTMTTDRSNATRLTHIDPLIPMPEWLRRSKRELLDRAVGVISAPAGGGHPPAWPPVVGEAEEPSKPEEQRKKRSAPHFPPLSRLQKLAITDAVRDPDNATVSDHDLAAELTRAFGRPVRVELLTRNRVELGYASVPRPTREELLARLAEAEFLAKQGRLDLGDDDDGPTNA